jgi:hypothetical protein
MLARLPRSVNVASLQTFQIGEACAPARRDECAHGMFRATPAASAAN